MYQDFSTEVKVSAMFPFSDFKCPTERSTSAATFQEVNGKCYYMTKEGCRAGNTGAINNGCPFQQTQDQCKTIFGPGTNGIVFEPTSLENNDSVLEAAKAAVGCNKCWFWIGVRNGSLKYRSNGKAVFIETIPWQRGQPSMSSSQTHCVNVQAGTMKWRANRQCNANLYTICETSF